MIEIYSKQHVLEALKYHLQPSSNQQFINYEKLGIIPLPDYIVKYENTKKPTKLYDKQTIRKIIEAIKGYRKRIRVKVCGIKGCERRARIKGLCNSHYRAGMSILKII